MRQPSKKNQNIKKSVNKKTKNNFHKRKVFKKSTNASDEDGSGLETFFRLNILDKIGLKYVQQFKAEQIGRFYDFFLPDYNVILECDGDYFHGNPEVYQDKFNKMQRYNKKIDESKNKWALMNGYIILRFWEKDIYEKTDKIIIFLKERLNIQKEIISINKSKKNGSFYIKKNQSIV